MRLTITCNRTNALLCLAVLASLWTILYFNLSHTNRQAGFRSSMVSKVPIDVAAAAAAVGDKKPADKPAPSGKSDFLLKSELVGATVVTRSATDWSRDDGTCDGDEHNVKTVLHSPAWDLPIFVHPKNIDKIVSRYVIEGSMWEHDQVRRFHDIVKQDSDLQFVAGDLPIFVHPKKIDVWVSGNVIDGRVWEHDQVRRFHDIVKQDADLQFVDIGGNIGVYGLTIAKLGRTVLFVEPLLKNVQKLCNSVRAGKYPDVYVIHNALSSTRFKVGFGTYEGNVGAKEVKNASSSGETAQAVLLDDLLEVFNPKKVTIKLDVEAHEAKVLLGGDNLFKSVDVRYLQLEWGRHRKSPSEREIIDFLTRHFFMKPYHPATDQLLDTKGYKTWPVDVFWKKTT